MSEVADITLEQIIARLREIAPAIKAEGVTKLAIFGSRARGCAPR
jgi:predicted nucleotidyltransferase